MRYVFYHCNNDAIKACHGQVDIERVTVWKMHNDPVDQMGWYYEGSPCPGLLKISPLQSHQLKISNVEFQRELNPVAEIVVSYVEEVEDFGSGKMAIEINN
ncbi:hypothetical protein THARTR1_08062 [Trichoderma harzianum]|uniref:Uncharacterized protein n=1 Tax=Trichoderma harzianum TaxID=5544 RepID=A0A2K0U0K2_TRIHA|nr:hypothetical protein THARTR1_08062 [Trichoderma harzianum]